MTCVTCGGLVLMDRYGELACFACARAPVNPEQIEWLARRLAFDNERQRRRHPSHGKQRL